jgi:4'-phosphopantetheinyl transferase
MRDLDADERSRHDSYRREPDRRRHLAAHLTVRDVLGARLGIDPAAVQLGRDPCPLCGEDHGRPVALDDRRGTQFSLAHTSGMVVVAVADTVVGVDVEPTSRTTAAEDLVAALNEHDAAEVDLLPPQARDRALLASWVRTEAVLKARGTGLGVDPATVAAGIRGTTRLGDLVVFDLAVGPDHLAALAAERDAGGSVPDVRVRDHRP